jgi:hypothetical protein
MKNIFPIGPTLIQTFNIDIKIKVYTLFFALNFFK